MKQLGLFAGIGGFELAARWMGWETVAVSEIDPFCQKVLKHHFTEAEILGDIFNEDFTRFKGIIDILTGGFPCQPVSVAGQRRGVEDDRFLWPEMRRAYRESQPRVIVAENVAGLFSILEPESLSEVEREEIQLFCEDESYQQTSTIERIQRRVIARIIEEIRADGYVLPELADGTPIVGCIPACAVNAPHRRDRAWIVAYANSIGLRRQIDGNGGPKLIDENGPGNYWQNFPTESLVCAGDDGLSSGLDLSAISYSKWRRESIKGAGNAIVPQVAYEIFKAIKGEMEI